MKLVSIEALVIRISRSCGGAGRVPPRPPRKTGEELRTVLARIGTDAGLTGWGESQAVAAPDVAGAIIHSLLKPVLEGREFNGTGLEIESLWKSMYNQMRACGQTGGFMLDAMAAVDIALWDLAGKIHGVSIAALIAGCQARTRLETYVDYLAGDTDAARLDAARLSRDAGCRRFKILYHSSERELLETYDALAGICGPENIAVDAQWRLDPAIAAGFGAELDHRGALWLESPFPPEDPRSHGALARRIRTPVAIGETYRTHFELAPFFRSRAMSIVQPDLGRCGISEGLSMARAAERAGMEVVPHLAPALGPLLFATLQFAAAVPNCRLVPHTPGAVETANEFSSAPVQFRDGEYMVPAAPGLGIELVEPEVRLVEVA
jgi:D-galactarolactone cycloisomerase